MLIRLSQIAPFATQLTIRCDRCNREGRLSVARLLRDHGADAPVRVAMLEMEARCDRRNATIYERCSAYAPELEEIMRKAEEPGRGGIPHPHAPHAVHGGDC